jgi:hypothetical protein
MSIRLTIVSAKEMACHPILALNDCELMDKHLPSRHPAHPKGISYGAKAGIQYLPPIAIKTLR